MTRQLNANRLAEDYISAQHPFRGRSASQVLQNDTTLTSAKLWVNSIKTIGRSSKVTDPSIETLKREKSKTLSHKWSLWKRFFRQKETDLMTKEEIAERRKMVQIRRNAALFIPDYDEEQTVFSENKNNSLELCDLEDIGNSEIKERK